MKTNLQEFRKHPFWNKNLNALYTVNGKKLTDKQVRVMIDWAIEKGYKYDTDIPEDEVRELLNL